MRVGEWEMGRLRERETEGKRLRTVEADHITARQHFKNQQPVTSNQ
jgi:hypothetical protein